ncbi:MAG: c-type cytochrome, partial [Blastocatellia bacterium]
MKRTLSFSLLCAVAALGIFMWLNSSDKTSAAVVTFNKDVAPIIQKNCQTCHRPGEVAPMSLLSYKEVRPWAKSIREAVTTRVMPPWFADPKHGEFSNDVRLSQKEIDTITAWVEGGAAEGDAKDLPPNPKFP